MQCVVGQTSSQIAMYSSHLYSAAQRRILRDCRELAAWCRSSNCRCIEKKYTSSSNRGFLANPGHAPMIPVVGKKLPSNQR